MKPFGQTIGIATTFFSLMVGTGLSRLLARESFHEIFPEDRWYCFIAALLLFLRFLFGSANHLWKEFGDKEVNDRTKVSIIRHLGALILFGFIAIRICYTYDALDFLVWNIRFGLLAATFALLGLGFAVWKGPIRPARIGRKVGCGLTQLTLRQPGLFWDGSNAKKRGEGYRPASIFRSVALLRSA